MSLRNPESTAAKWIGRLLGALFFCSCAMAVVAIKHEEKLARSHHEVSYCFTGIVWNKDTPDVMALFWPCGSIDEVEGAKLPERDI